MHTRVDKFVGLQTACAPAMCGFAACLQASSVCEFWGARALQMCVHAGLRAVSVCWVFVLQVCVCLHTGGVLQAVLVCVWGGCVCRSVGLQAARGAVRTNLQTVSRVCTCGGVAGCLCALCVCGGLQAEGASGGCPWGCPCPPRAPCEWGATGCARSLGVQLAACVCVCTCPVGAAAPRAPPTRLPGTPRGLGGLHEL